jgi:hypothetical protein
MFISSYRLPNRICAMDPNPGPLRPRVRTAKNRGAREGSRLIRRRGGISHMISQISPAHKRWDTIAPHGARLSGRALSRGRTWGAALREP